MSFILTVITLVCFGQLNPTIAVATANSVLGEYKSGVFTI